MPHKITKKEFDRIKRYRKNMARGTKFGYLVFKARDGDYYKTENDGIQGSKEMFEFNRKINHSIDNQMKLI